jgi:HK97 family phage portal protein
MVPVPASDPNARMWIARYDYVNADGTELPVPVEDVIQIRWPSVDLEQPWVALPPLVAVAAEVDATNEAMRYVRALLKNDAMPRVVLTTPVGTILDDTAVNRMKGQWGERYGGDQRGGVAVLEEGVTVSRIGMSMAELAFDALMRVPEAHIAAAFRVPAIVAGLGIGLDRSTYSNYAEARISYTQQTLVPLWRMWEGEIQTALGDLFGVVVRYDLSTVAALQEDQAARVERTINAWNAGIMTRNEARKALALPIDDAGDVYALPTSVQLLDAQHSPVIGMPTLAPTPAAAPADDTPVETRALKAPARSPHPVADYVPPPIDDVAESMFRRLRRYVTDQYRTAAQEIDAIAERRAAEEQARNV